MRRQDAARMLLAAGFLGPTGCAAAPAFSENASVVPGAAWQIRAQFGPHCRAGRITNGGN
jgi:hypothetical protein